jgi:CheY-like chemotaxis protein
VFLNLIVNAGQAIPEERHASGTVTVRTRKAADGFAVVEVADDGVGISQQARPRLFEPFFTTRPAGEGTGMGLTIAKTLVESFGGRIEVESEPGKGACFRVALPPTDHPAYSVQLGELPDPPEGRRGRVLIVDGEASVGAALKRVLESEHDVSTAVDGPSALALLRDGQRFDAVLCDLLMPGFGGIELHLEAERLSPDLARRFLFMGSAAFSEDARDRVDPLGRPLLEKPIQASVLRRAIRECVD